MERVYVDMSQVDGACVGVFVSGKEVVPVGTTVYSMLVDIFSGRVNERRR